MRCLWAGIGYHTSCSAYTNRYTLQFDDENIERPDFVDSLIEVALARKVDEDINIECRSNEDICFYRIDVVYRSWSLDGWILLVLDPMDSGFDEEFVRGLMRIVPGLFQVRVTEMLRPM